MEEETLKDKCKKCGLLREDHTGFWKVTECKFKLKLKRAVKGTSANSEEGK